MFGKFRVTILLALLALTLSTLACGASALPQPAEAKPVQSVQATESPAEAPSGSGTDPNAVVSYSQIVPPDELENLLINLTPTLTENSYPGGTSCIWSYVNAAGQTSTFSIQVDFSPNAVSLWESTRQSELSNEPSDIVVNGIDGLADESYVWSSKTTGLYVVYARKGGKTLIMRYVPQDVIYMGTESGIIDMVERFFNRF
ncbi:MAG: hypothetical protein HXY35_04225 [Chloroflexi bacterium]|nr:hypothetical protein [Chloroflexota bacterium]